MEPRRRRSGAGSLRLVLVLAAVFAAGAAWADGPVASWGDDTYGQSSLPPSVAPGNAISAGGLHSCAIQAGTGNVVCWGDDSYGQATPPASVDGSAGTASAIAAGGSHSLAIRYLPEPAAGPLLAAGLAALLALARLRRSTTAARLS